MFQPSLEVLLSVPAPSGEDVLSRTYIVPRAKVAEVKRRLRELEKWLDEEPKEAK